MDMVKKYFPYNTARNGQLETIKALFEAKENGYKHFILDANVGYGKSAIARTLVEAMKCENLEDSYILTSTKMLQEQYYRECINNKHNVDYKVGKGRSNFYCREYNNYTLCSDGSCRDGTLEGQCEYRKYGDCDYYKQKEECLKSDVAIINYDILLSDESYEHRDIMVCDEAHNIDDKIMQRIGITLNEAALKKYGITITKEDYDDNTIDYWVERLESISVALEAPIQNKELFGLKPKDVESAQSLQSRIKARIKDINKNKNYWFVNVDSFNHKIMIKPLDIRNYANSFLLNDADFHLYMSGSIVDPDNFSKYLGLSSDEIYYYKAKSSFNLPKNNPIIPKYCGQLTYKQKQKTLPKTYEVIEEILDNHPNDKGIIHCHSREFRNKIMDNVYDNRLISYNTSEEKEEVLEYFEYSDDNDVIVAYSLQEGLDLPYDNIRFQIMYKVPFPFLGDPQVKARKNNDNDWYMIETIRTLIQAHGRGMRAEDDYCKNYLIDSSFQSIFNSKLCPSELKDCLQKVKL